jgi:hypothetical protein
LLQVVGDRAVFRVGGAAGVLAQGSDAGIVERRRGFRAGSLRVQFWKFAELPGIGSRFVAGTSAAPIRVD